MTLYDTDNPYEPIDFWIEKVTPRLLWPWWFSEWKDKREKV